MVHAGLNERIALLQLILETKDWTDAPLEPIEAPHAGTQQNLGNYFKM